MCEAGHEFFRMTCRSRGEFKTPGGKLIAVEIDVVDGELRNVVVTGDFFLYPEEALPILARAPVDREPVAEGVAMNADEWESRRPPAYLDAASFAPTCDGSAMLAGRVRKADRPGAEAAMTVDGTAP